MHYEGPIYRPPSEAASLLIQATVGCPHNRCTFCMIYKQGPRFKIRPLAAIQADILEARETYGPHVRTLFLPAGNTIAMPTDALAAICRYAREVFTGLERITVYGSAQYVLQKGPGALQRLAEAGLDRIHMGLESGDDTVLRRIRKGADSAQQVTAGQWIKAAGIELSLYVMLGIGGRARSAAHATATADVLSRIAPDFIRLRTFVPKENTPLLADVRCGAFQMLGPHEVLKETRTIVAGVDARSYLTSDHYTNYIDLQGPLPSERERLLAQIEAALDRDATAFRPFFVGKV